MKVLSIILFVVGIFLFLLGFLFKIMHWPGAMTGRLIGLALLGIGLILFVIIERKDK